MSYIETFCSKLILASEASNYDDAILEWVYLGDSERHLDNCICGHSITQRCRVQNRYNSTTLIIGNCCINKFNIDREHWNKSRLFFLQYAYSKCGDDKYKCKFCEDLINRFPRYSNFHMSEKQKKFLESIADKPYRWNY